MPLSERFHLKTRERYEAYRIGAFSCKQEANPIWNENGIVLTEGKSNMKPIRYEMKTVSCKRGLICIALFGFEKFITHDRLHQNVHKVVFSEFNYKYIYI